MEGHRTGQEMQEFAHDYLGAINTIAAIIGAVASLVSAVAWVAVLVLIIIIVRDAMKARGE